MWSADAEQEARQQAGQEERAGGPGGDSGERRATCPGGRPARGCRGAARRGRCGLRGRACPARPGTRSRRRRRRRKEKREGCEGAEQEGREAPAGHGGVEAVVHRADVIGTARALGRSGRRGRSPGPRRPDRRWCGRPGSAARRRGNKRGAALGSRLYCLMLPTTPTMVHLRSGVIQIWWPMGSRPGKNRTTKRSSTMARAGPSSSRKKRPWRSGMSIVRK